MWLVVLAGYTLWAACELIPLYRQKYWRDFWANLLLGAVSLAAALALSFGVRIPSPAKPVQEFVISIVGK